MGGGGTLGVMWDLSSPTRDQTGAPCSGSTESTALNCQRINSQSDFLSQLQIYRLSRYSMNQLYIGLLDSCLVWRKLQKMFILYYIRCSFYIAWFNFLKIIQWNNSPSNLHLTPGYPPSYENSELQVSLQRWYGWGGLGESFSFLMFKRQSSLEQVRMCWGPTRLHLISERDGQSVLGKRCYKTMKSTVFWKHEQEMLSKMSGVFLESHAWGGRGRWSVSYRHLEQMVKDMLVYPKKAIGLPERGHCPHDLSRWSFLGNLSGEGGKGPEQKPQEVYTGWGWGRGWHMRNSGWVPFPPLLWTNNQSLGLQPPWTSVFSSVKGGGLH